MSYCIDENQISRITSHVREMYVNVVTSIDHSRFDRAIL